MNKNWRRSKYESSMVNDTEVILSQCQYNDFHSSLDDRLPTLSIVLVEGGEEDDVLLIRLL